jgi:ABC-type amino acid transport substrate-binding protein
LPLEHLQSSKIAAIQKLGKQILQKPSNLLTSTQEALSRVEWSDGKFAFVMETTIADYEMQKNCNLTKIGPELHLRSYGLGLQKGSKWTEKVSHAILSLQETGGIQALYDKWWRGTESENCEPFRPLKEVFVLDGSHTRTY